MFLAVAGVWSGGGLNTLFQSSNTLFQSYRRPSPATGCTAFTTSGHSSTCSNVAAPWAGKWKETSATVGTDGYVKCVGVERAEFSPKHHPTPSTHDFDSRCCPPKLTKNNYKQNAKTPSRLELRSSNGRKVEDGYCRAKVPKNGQLYFWKRTVRVHP